jgi:tetratricopeptide (TPR) repeat protein
VLIERTEGNPMFVEESVRTLVESDVLVGERGHYRLARAFESTQVPATVQAVLAARIDRLTPENKRLLQAAAVIGKDVPYPLLQAIAELPESDLRAGLARLQGAEFLYETSLFPDLEYTFKHALTHEVAYESLLHERRRALHARIVAAIEKLHSDRLGEQGERLAHHAFHAEIWEKAATYSRQAGAKAARRSAHREAAGYFEKALVALQHVPPTRDAQERAVDLRIELRPSLVALGEIERALLHMREAARLASALDDQRRLGWVSALSSSYFWWMGQPERAVEAAQRAHALADLLGDFALQLQTNARLSFAYTAMGEYRQAVECAAVNIAVLEGERLLERYGFTGLPAAVCRALSSLCLAELGEFAMGVALGEEAIRIAEAENHTFSIVLAYWAVGHLRLRQGDLSEAITLLERSVEIGQGRDVAAHLVLVGGVLGSAYGLAGRVPEAVAVLEQAVEQAAAFRLMFGQAQRASWLAENYLLAGQRADARAWADRALALSHEHCERGSEAWALRVLGEIAVHSDPPEIEHAETHYCQALSLAEELEMRPLAAHCHLGLGTLYRKIGRDEHAQPELTTAAELYRAMEMPFWLARAQAELVQSASAP